MTEGAAARLLVVDDNEWNRELLSRRLTQSGYDVEAAASGTEAIQKVEAGPFDLVVLDVMMPGLSGLDVLKVLRKTWSLAELPVIMATARDGSDAIVEAFTLGANDYVAKPLDLPVVLARISTQLALKRAQERLRRLVAAPQVLVATCPKCGRCLEAGAGVCPEDGEALFSRGPVPIRVEGRYRLVRVLGEGGMATVFEAEDERLLRTVALKVLRSEFFGEVVVQRRFEQEAEALGKISHPGVVTVFDYGDLEGGSLYLVMELLRGRDLEAVLRSHGPGTPQQVAALVRQAGAALAAAHAAGVLHRDIKPGNVFFSPEPAGTRIKLLDFGLAKSLRVDHPLTRSGLIVGTPVYMSPEQIQEKPMDERSDLYSLATVAWEALTGQRLIRSLEMYDILSEIVEGTRARLSDRVAGVSRAADTAFSAAVERDPARRPSNLGEWAESFAAALEAAPATAEGWPDRFPPGRLPSRGDPWADTSPVNRR